MVWIARTAGKANTDGDSTNQRLNAVDSSQTKNGSNTIDLPHPDHADLGSDRIRAETGAWGERQAIKRGREERTDLWPLLGFAAAAAAPTAETLRV